MSALGASAWAAAAPLDVMPVPAEVTVTGSRVDAGGKLEVATSGPASARLQAEIARAVARWQSRIAPAAGVNAAPFRLSVACASSSPEIPSATEDESYTLVVAAGQATLNARTDIGALRGIETLLQIPRNDGAGWTLAAATIRDRPRFPWRGLMIDVARRWQPIEVIERNIDAMLVVKMNVLHLHLTDNQGFRIESLTHPELQNQGSDGHYFTQEQMRAIIAYAGARGIRVVPEFDIPGHSTSWVVSHPELASLPGPYGIERQWGVFDPVLDPTNEATYALLGDFLGEMAALFPDRFLHIGGDENNGVQWNANPRIQAYIREHGLEGNAGLHAYFNRRIGEILARHGKRLVGWDEILNPGLPKDSVIDSWRGSDALGIAAASGLDGILSNGFYIDLCYPAADHYAADPLPISTTLTPAQRVHVLGGEATMWSEWVTPETIDSRIWPRTAAIAERLWSPENVRDVDEMYRRLALVSPRLAEAGSLHLRNRDVMLRHLVGQNLDVHGVGALQLLISLLEPVKHYERGAIQIWSNQLVPLVGLADAVLPESAPSREFAGQVDRLLFGSAKIDRDEASAIRDSMEDWSEAGGAIGTLANTYPGVREAVPQALALVSACAAGTGAVDALTQGAPLSEEKLAASLGALKLAGASNESATELPVLRPIRLLVTAAALQAERPGMTAEAWRARVTAAAFPEAAP